VSWPLGLSSPVLTHSQLAEFFLLPSGQGLWLVSSGFWVKRKMMVPAGQIELLSWCQDFSPFLEQLIKLYALGGELRD